MVYLVIGALGVNVAVRSAHRISVPVGEVRRSFSGKPRSTVSDYITAWEGVETSWMTRAAANTLRAALEDTTPPVAISGDLTGSINAYFLNVREVDKDEFGGAEYIRIGFDIWAES